MTTDPMGFFRQMWAEVGQAPLSPEQISKKISDLRLVEGWLSLNLQMVQATISTFETQKRFVEGIQPKSAAASSSPGESSVPPPPANPWGAMQQQFANQLTQWMQASTDMASAAGQTVFTPPPFTPPKQ